MNLTEKQKYDNFIKKQQDTFPGWIVKDHGAGGHVEMMRNLLSKEGKRVLVFIWNDESATIFPHPFHENRYIGLKDWHHAKIFQALWDDQNKWISLIYRDNENFTVYPEAREVFDDKTIQELLDIFQELRKMHKNYDEEEAEENAYIKDQSLVEIGDVLIVNHDTLYRVIQADSDCEEYKYGLLNIKTNKIELKSKHLDFKQGDELFGPDSFDIITSIIKSEIFEQIRKI